MYDGTVKRRFCCMLILPFWNVEILLHFNVQFSHFSTGCWCSNWIFACTEFHDFTLLAKFGKISCMQK